MFIRNVEIAVQQNINPKSCGLPAQLLTEGVKRNIGYRTSGRLPGPRQMTSASRTTDRSSPQDLLITAKQRDMVWICL